MYVTIKTKMKIRLNIRPLITYKDERFENGYWEDKGILNLDEAIKKIQEINWAKSAKELRTIVTENEDLTIYKIMEPGFNLYNKETEAELFVGLLGDDFFDISLTTFKGEEMSDTEISGLGFNQIQEIVKLFYTKNYSEIKSYSSKISQSKSEIKELLTNRDTDQTAQGINKKLMQFGIYLIIAIILYLIVKMTP